MSANTVAGVDGKTAFSLDTFWNSLSREHRAALHTAFNMVDKRTDYISFRNAEEILRNSGSGRNSISSVRGDFFRFMHTRIEECTDGVSMMKAILKWGTLSAEEQRNL